MTGSLRALLTNCLDYAGLYPPALLPLPAAADAYAAAQNSPEAWILARFVCPAARLEELAASDFATQWSPLRVSATGRRTQRVDEYLTQLAHDLKILQSVHQPHESVVIDGYETCLPSDLVETANDHELNRLLGSISSLVRAAECQRVHVLCEVPQVAAWADGVRRLMRGLAEMRESNDVMHEPCLGFKLRAGGSPESRRPTSAEMACVIHACRDARLPWKATAGLHHPLPTTDAQTDMRSHGLLNLLVATVLAEAHSLSEERICRVLDDENPANFVFHDDALSWCDLKVPTPKIQYTRLHRLLSIGSCSFTEPCAGLAELGLLGV